MKYYTYNKFGSNENSWDSSVIVIVVQWLASLILAANLSKSKFLTQHRPLYNG